MMLFDRTKAKRLLTERGINMEEVAEMIVEGKYLDIIENAARPAQMMFVFKYKGYVHAVPFVTDKKGNVIIKTVYPSRKLGKIYGGEK